MNRSRYRNLWIPTRLVAIVVCLFASIRCVTANDIAVSSITLTGQNTASDFTQIQFSLSWQNSWRLADGPSNWDAAWVFAKFRVGGSNPTFSNVTLTNGSTTFTLPSVANLRVGMPVRKVSGGSTIAANTVITAINTSTNQVTLSAVTTTTASNNTIEFTRIWEHAWLNDVGHTVPSEYSLAVGLQAPGTAFNATTNPGIGAFINRSGAGAGSVSISNARLRWNYGANGVADDAIVSVQVFAIEMVYVPQGSFFIGSVGASGSFTNGSWTTGNAIPLQITSENALTVAQTAGNLWGTSSAGSNTIGPGGSIAAAYPKGFAAFYCMKYELSQGQYRDFYNTLTYAQQENRSGATSVPGDGARPGVLDGTNRNRNGLDILTVGSSTTNTPAVAGCNLDGDAVYNESTDGEWIPCNWLTWMDHCAVLDWAGLRPMTELEYEKACRGTGSSVNSEYAWGTATITAANNITNSGLTNENTNTAGANAVYDNQATVQGPLRTGSFAGAATTREQSGGTYYGIMEMSGNLAELIVTAGDATGRSFTAVHGDGTLSAAGHATTTAWPGLVTGQVTGATGSGSRGGYWSNPNAGLMVSDRGFAVNADIARRNYFGIRGVRTAP